jgi:hypothetical protein
MKIIGKISLSMLILTPAVVLAQGIKDAGDKLTFMREKGVGLSSNFQGLTGTVLSAIFYVLGTVFLILMIYGGFVWIKAAGRDPEIDRAKKIIITAVVGMMVVLASYAITNFILGRVGSPTA